MRYLPLTQTAREAMKKSIGISTIDQLFADVPPEARLAAAPLPPPMSELACEREMAALAAQNLHAGTAPFFAGAGAYHHHIPASVDHLIQRSEFMTAYTPYQPEIAQGTLQVLFEFQTQTARLTGMDIANASMYDGPSACAEAVLMACRITKKSRAVLSSRLHPHYSSAAETLARFAGCTIVRADHSGSALASLAEKITGDTACVVVQNPDLYGSLADLAPLAEQAHKKGALLIAVVSEIISLGAVKPPGEMGADIVAAEGQSLGNPLGFGGPYVGLLAARQKFVRQMPGRLCGKTLDAGGETAYVLTLATREQHIRRERATSNICTNSGLCALAFTCHLALLGGEGLHRLALLNHARASRLAADLAKLPGITFLTGEHFFNEFAIATPLAGAEVIEKLAQKGIIGGVPVSRLLPDDAKMKNAILIAATEMTTDADSRRLIDALAEILKTAHQNSTRETQ